ncbi:biotin carboxyl carrier protein [Bradyrhizobium sp. USDA 329]
MTSSHTISHLILRSAERASRRMQARLWLLALRDAASQLLRVRDRQHNLPRLGTIVALVLAISLAGCTEKRDPGFQGWVEADMIFVSPDEAGRVTKLNVREGEEVKVGDALYSVDDDLQRADLNQNKATLANAQQTYDRASSLSRTGSGTQANLDSAVSALRVAEARVATSETRMARRKGFAPVAGTIQQIYFREGEMVGAQRSGAVDHAARQHEAAFLRAGDRIAEARDRRHGARLVRQLRGRPHRKDLLHRDLGRIHPACHLQPR